MRKISINSSEYFHCRNRIHNKRFEHRSTTFALDKRIPNLLILNDDFHLYSQPFSKRRAAICLFLSLIQQNLQCIAQENSYYSRELHKDKFRQTAQDNRYTDSTLHNPPVEDLSVEINSLNRIRNRTHCAVRIFQLLTVESASL